MLYQWLCYMQQKEQNFIQSRFNIGERYVSKYSFKVDGFCEKTITIYEFDGCLCNQTDLTAKNKPNLTIKLTRQRKSNGL